MKIAVLSAVTLIFFVSLGCQQDEAPRGVLARIEGAVITVEDFNRAFQEMKLENQFSPGDHATRMRMKESFLDQLIEEALVLREAKRLGVTVTEQEVDAEIMTTRNDYKGESLRDHLNAQGLSFEDWKERVKKNILIEKTITVGSRYEGTISTEEAHQYYVAHRSDYILPEQAKARQIVVASRRNADKIMRLLKEGRDFEELAVVHSLGPEGRFGGDLGYFARGDMPEEFNVVFSMKEGQVSTIVKSPYGFHIFKVEGRTPARQLTFEEVTEDIKRKIVQIKSDQLYYKWLEELRRNAKIEKNSHLLEYTE
ncbi:MAG: hypothetical protein GTN81_01915 [Proteobacteria bacterium]|nr:hypothetical protein [Pseudomonadota bacterium]